MCCTYLFAKLGSPHEFLEKTHGYVLNFPTTLYTAVLLFIDWSLAENPERNIDQLSLPTGRVSITSRENSL